MEERGRVQTQILSINAKKEIEKKYMFAKCNWREVVYAKVQRHDLQTDGLITGF